MEVDRFPIDCRSALEEQGLLLQMMRIRICEDDEIAREISLTSYLLKHLANGCGQLSTTIEYSHVEPSLQASQSRFSISISAST